MDFFRGKAKEVEEGNAVAKEAVMPDEGGINWDIMLPVVGACSGIGVLSLSASVCAHEKRILSFAHAHASTSARNALFLYFRLRRFECLLACIIKILMLEIFFSPLSHKHTPKAACCSVSVVVYCWFKVRHDITGSENPSRRRLPDFRSGLSSPCPSRSRLSPALPKSVTSRERVDSPF